MRLRGHDLVTNLLFVALIAGIATFFVLSVLVFGGAQKAHFAAGRFSESTCVTSTSPSERCYQSVVTNDSKVAGRVRCVLRSVGGPPATFFNHLTTYETPATVAPGSSILLTIRITPSTHTSPALPAITCDPV